ncbi:uncharacterized protein LOC132200774 [Neocloeon triangulifer]|uniref:uncharacterized protein LOC132200774 n=1 Tax=Neocloeon triangulifer TaxID=2078957 RepID=UPI00286F01B0|nr:uncharacterized protein LOC132200774 [Neocloeon triangulifer]
MLRLWLLAALFTITLQVSQGISISVSQQVQKLAAQKTSVICKNLVGQSLRTCCSTPISDYFTQDEKKQCNSLKVDATLFLWTYEYQLHKSTNAKNNSLILSSTALAKAFGKQACFLECMFTKKEILVDSALVEDTAKTVLAANLDDPWKTLVETAITNCSSTITTVTDLVPTIDVTIKAKVSKTCYLAPVLLMQCVLSKVGYSCPEGKIAGGAPCINSLAKFNTCDLFPATSK